jgi:8-oxo-dGTP pyrophosphatase MutT (NUDIX family)
MSWYPHVTVASIVERDQRFLLVRERDEKGDEVFNQPAGHLEQHETLLECAVRETLEETGWLVKPIATLGVRLYHSANNGITYLRTNIIAETVKHFPERTLDTGIIDIHWLTVEELKSRQHQLRSPMVLMAIDDYLTQRHFPLHVVEAANAQQLIAQGRSAS